MTKCLYTGENEKPPASMAFLYQSLVLGSKGPVLFVLFVSFYPNLPVM